MSSLRVIVDESAGGTGGGEHYAEELIRALVATRPTGATVAGIVPSSPANELQVLEERLPGVELLRSALTRPQLAAAWQYGFTALPGSGMVHATSPLAPLRRHDRAASPGSQIAVTIHDATAWTAPGLLSPRDVAWMRAMGRRADRHADAIVAPTFAVAADLDAQFGFGDRIRVIGGAPSTSLRHPGDAVARRSALELPERYLVARAGWGPGTGLAALVEALGRLDESTLVVVGAAGSEDELRTAAGTGTVDRIRVLDRLDDDDLGAVLGGADLLIQPDLAGNLSLPLLEAFSFGVPVVHSDAPALVEVADGAGIVVEREPAASYASRLADAIRGVLDDDALRARLAVAGTDRAKAFSWRDSAEKVWQLHADL